MSFAAKYLRLLPAVVVVGTGLLAIKGIDLARATQMPAAYDEPDNSGLAPADTGGAPVKDFASDDGASASEVDVLASLTRRRAELDARERGLAMRENLLSAGEGRVDQKIAALKMLQTQIQALLSQRDAKQDEQIASLVKTYSTMKPKDAARIFNALGDDVLIPVAKGMKSDVLAPVLAAMNPDAAQKLTVKLAALLKLPEAPPATVCPDPAAAGTTAELTSPLAAPSAEPPQQSAALGNPPVTLLPTPPVATPAPAAATPPTPAPAAAAPAPIPPKPPVQHPITAKPTTPPPAKPAATPAAAPPAKPTTQAAATPPAAAHPTAPAAASAPPTPLGSTHGG